VDARWRESGACTLNTAETGALTFELQGNRLALVAAERLAPARLVRTFAAATMPCDDTARAR
jgi:hypothetical protein